MNKKKSPILRRANTCTNCKHVNFIDGKQQMTCKKYKWYVLADSICDDHIDFFDRVEEA